MKKVKKICVVCRRMLKKNWKEISLKDRALIIIMALLLWQSAYVLFVGDGANLNSKSIDVVIRTTSAAVFGYFLSANFLNKKNTQEENIKKEIEETTCICQTTKKIEKSKLEEEKEEKEEKEEEEKYVAYFTTQIMIATIIGIVSLVVLIVARDIPGIPIESASALSQFRDFVSGCVGFLIGIPNEKEKKN